MSSVKRREREELELDMELDKELDMGLELDKELDMELNNDNNRQLPTCMQRPTRRSHTCTLNRGSSFAMRPW
jgi:hypothetical protein